MLLPQASALEAADIKLKALLTPEVLQNIVNLIPEEWLEWEGSDETPDEIRSIYLQFLTTRLAHSEVFTKTAQDARQALI